MAAAAEAGEVGEALASLDGFTVSTWAMVDGRWFSAAAAIHSSSRLPRHDGWTVR